MSDAAEFLAPVTYAQASAALARGDHHGAAGVCRRLLASDAKHQSALRLLGYLELLSERPGTALELLEGALSLEPHDPVSWLNRAAAELALARPEAARRSCETCLSQAPNYAHAHYLTGKIAAGSGAQDVAYQAFQRALSLENGNEDYRFALGSTCLALGRHAEARALCQQIVDQNGAHVDALLNLGVAQLELGRHAEAIPPLERAVSLRPDMALAQNALGNALRLTGKTESALDHYRRALALHPTLKSANFNYALALVQEGRPAEAIPYVEMVARLDPQWPLLLGSLWHTRHLCCDWTEEAADRAHLMQAVEHVEALVVEPFTFLTVSDSGSLQLKAARNFARRTGVDPLTAPPARRVDAPLRVAYVSADLREHPVARQLVAVFEAHEARHIEAYAVALSPAEDSEIGKRVRDAFGARYLDVSALGDAEIAEAMRSIGIAIAVDLGGFTKRARPSIFAHRPAPLQVNYLGYPGSMGADYIDYLIADAYLIPEACRSFYSEAIVRLPGCFQGNDPKLDWSLPASSRASHGLASDAIVYCSFNSTLKLTGTMFELWLEVLAAVPDSQLWLLAENEAARQNLRRRAVARGIDPGRLVFAGRVPYEAHLSRLSLADVFLDTFPFNGGSTASDALWAGLPVVTLSGEAFASRMAGSLLTAFNLEGLIARDTDSYRAMAINLGTNASSRAHARAQLTGPARARLFDAQRFARALETTYERIWQRHCSGEAPCDLTVDKEAPSGD
jgi:predicted O-linked N-acetylglucosamine transferase (SPINDLY family)